MYRYNLSCFIGRFSPPHLGHRAIVEQALAQSERVLIAIGSAEAPRRFDYVPFTAAEREQMIRLMFSAEENQRIHFAYIPDQGNMPAWTSLIRKAANAIEPDNSKIALIGHSKDNSSYYLKAFRGWDSIAVENYMGLSSTQIREKFFPVMALQHDDTAFVHREVYNWLHDFANTDAYAHLCEEAIKCALDVENYGRIDPATGQKVYGPYLAADAIIVQGDYVLMIERGGHPYKGCVAFPGGFVEHDEDVTEAAIREVIEETKLKVPEQVLRRSVIYTEAFSSPFRDPRGRVVSFATLFHLDPQPPANMTDPKEIEKFLALPRVRGADDATKAFWKPISEIKREECSFDHFNMLNRMLQILPRD